MSNLRYEVWVDDNSGACIAAFRYLDDARAFAQPIDGLVFDVDDQADVTYFPVGPERVGGHEVRPDYLRARERR
jgi:hypothetical protein